MSIDCIRQVDRVNNHSSKSEVRLFEVHDPTSWKRDLNNLYNLKKKIKIAIYALRVQAPTSHEKPM